MLLNKASPAIYRVFSMNKGELIAQISDETRITTRDIDLVLSKAIALIVNRVSGGENVTIVGFGSFQRRDRRERRGRNPKTGEEMLISATRVPVFSAGKEFKDRVV